MSHCEFADSDIPSRYVAEKLPPAEAERFEEHYFACSRCWQEVQAGTAARAALRTRRAPKVWWASLAAAAVIAIVATLAIRDKPDEVLRGGSERTIALDAQRIAAQLRIRWRAVPRASRYDIAVRSAEGAVLQRKSAEATAVVFDGVSGGDVFVRVTALDAQGEELARSSLVRVRSP